MKLSLSLCGFFVLLVCVTNTQAKGLAALKKKSHHANSSASIFLFEEITILPRMIRFQIKGQPSYEVQRLKEPIAEWVEIMPKFLKTIDNDTQISRYKKSYNECVVFTEKYPPTKELLAPYMKILNDDIKQYDSGLVKYEGNWIIKKQYKIEQKEAEEEEALKAKLEEEERSKRRAEKLVMIEKERAEREEKREQAFMSLKEKIAQDGWLLDSETLEKALKDSKKLGVIGLKKEAGGDSFHTRKSIEYLFGKPQKSHKEEFETRISINIRQGNYYAKVVRELAGKDTSDWKPSRPSMTAGMVYVYSDSYAKDKWGDQEDLVFGFYKDDETLYGYTDREGNWVYLD